MKWHARWQWQYADALFSIGILPNCRVLHVLLDVRVKLVGLESISSQNAVKFQTKLVK